MKDLGGRTQHKLEESKVKGNKKNKAIRVMVIDDHEPVRYGLRRMLEEEEDMKVTGVYANAEEAFSQLEMLSPDIVLMDTHMPGMNGIEATRHLKGHELHYDGDVIMLAESMDYRDEALQAGAANYLLKGITREALAQAIREVYHSERSPAEHNSFLEKAVQLIVPPSTNATQLLRFICQLEERLNEDTNSPKCATIANTIGSREYGTVITIMVRSTVLANLLERLENMPEVEEVKEESTANSAFFSLPKKSRVLSRTSFSPSKRIRITLREPDMARQELVTALH